MESQAIFDRDLINKNYKRWKDNFHASSFLFKFSEEEIINRLSLIKRDFESVAIIGSRNCGILFDYLDKKNSNIDVIDINADEILPFETDSYDLIISIMELHKINNIKQLLLQIRYSLKEGGAFLGVMAGESNLIELKKAIMMAETEISGGINPRIHPVMGMKSMSGLLQEIGFSMPVIDIEKLTILYKNSNHLMKDLRYMGESNVLKNRSKKFTKSALFKKTDDLYKKYYINKENRINASFELIFLTGWADN